MRIGLEGEVWIPGHPVAIGGRIGGGGQFKFDRDFAVGYQEVPFVGEVPDNLTAEVVIPARAFFLIQPDFLIRIAQAGAINVVVGGGVGLAYVKKEEHRECISEPENHCQPEAPDKERAALVHSATTGFIFYFNDIAMSVMARVDAMTGNDYGGTFSLGFGGVHHGVEK